MQHVVVEEATDGGGSSLIYNLTASFSVHVFNGVLWYFLQFALVPH